jgi:hypothetical protein
MANYGQLRATNQNGKLLVSLGDGQGGNKWGTAVSTVSIPLQVLGDIEVADGATNYIPPIIVEVPDGCEVTLVAVWGVLRAGSCVIDIDQNGSGVSGLTGLTITTTNTRFTPGSPTPVSNGDLFAPVVDSI